MRKAGFITVIPIEQTLAEGNCGRVINRGEEACECAVKLTPGRGTYVRSEDNRRQSCSQQNCEVTNRNSIQGRNGQASAPCSTKPSTSNRSGKWGTCAVKLQRLIKGDLPDVSERKLASSRSEVVRTTSCRAEVSRRHSTQPQTPLRTGRPER